MLPDSMSIDCVWDKEDMDGLKVEALLRYLRACLA